MTIDVVNPSGASDRLPASRSGSLGPIAKIAGGSALGQFVVLASTPLLSRIYSPAEFGEYAAFLAICSVFLAVTCLRYDAALNASSDEEATQIFYVACFGAALAAVVVLLFASSSWGGDLIDRIVGRHVAATWVAAAALVCGIFQTTSAMTIRRGLFGWSGALRAAQPAMFSISAIVLPIGLISSSLLGFLIALPLAGWFSAGRPPNGREVFTAAWRFREFPMMSLPTAILDAMSLAIPVWSISSHYSSADAGNYAQVLRLLAAPLLLLALAVGQVFLKRAGDMVRAGQPVRGFQRRVVLGLVSATCVLVVCIALFFSPLLSWLLGQNWRTDTVFLLLVFAPVGIRCCVSPVTGIFVVCNRLRICAVWQVLYFMITAGTFYLLAGHVSLERLLAAYAMSETISYGLYLYLADKVAT